MFYWFLLFLYVIHVASVESASVVSSLRQLDNSLMELNKTLVIGDNDLSVKFDKCNICTVFLEDLKVVLNGSASPIASEIMMNRCEYQLQGRIIFEPICELVLRELVRVVAWLGNQINSSRICTSLHACGN